VSVPVLLHDVINRVRGLLGVHYRDGAHRLRVDIAPDAEWVMGNPVVIEQIFVNLLLNSAEASPSPRYVIVTASPSSPPHGRKSEGASKKTLEHTPFHVCIRVWDDGPGIPASFREFIFDAFFTTKPNSIGLGLSIARHAAESLDGALVLMDDEPGTSFALYLPGCEGSR
jgi:signal transduction histidine kinase